MVPAGRVTVMVLPALPSRAPVDEAVKPTCHVAWAPAAVEVSDAVTPVTVLAAVIDTDVVPGWVSDVVEALTVAGPVVVGLVTPKSATETTSPAATGFPKLN